MAELTTYGGLKPTALLGQQTFANHDPLTTWDDGQVAVELAADVLRETEDAVARAIDGLKSSLSRDLGAYGAYQVRDAVVDYVSNAFMDVAIVDGRVCLCFDASNNEAEFRACWDLGQLLQRANAQAVNAGDKNFLNALAHSLALLLPEHRPAVPEREPAPPLRRTVQSRFSARQPEPEPAAPEPAPATQGLRKAMSSRVVRSNTHRGGQ